MSANPLTAAQRRQLERALKDWRGLGLIEYMGTRGWGWASWDRMMQRLCADGYCTPYPHGGYQITDKGREALRNQEKMS